MADSDSDMIGFWTAIGTMALAVVAFVQFWVQFYFSKKQGRDTREAVDRTIEAQQKISREETALRLYLTMLERFDSSHLQRSRKALAYHFSNSGQFAQVREEVLNFFEDLGALYRQKRVNEELTYDAFSYYSKGWWAACRPYVSWLRDRKKDTSLFAGFEQFAEQMMELEAKDRQMPVGQIALSEAEVKEFLDEEYFV